jgi:anti-sigma factor RsiW
MTLPAHLDCATVADRIQAFLDGELSSVECDAIERHCLGCTRCAAVVRGLRQTIGMCRDAGRAPLPESVRERARDQVEQLLKKQRPTPDGEPRGRTDNRQ